MPPNFFNKKTGEIKMGWFNNTLTANRVHNTATILTCAALLEANQTVLQGVQQFSTEQVNRGNRLSAQAFSIQGASSNLGLQLQQAVGELNTFKREANGLNSELGEHTEYFTALVEQFSIPRAARQLNLSGKEMTEVATHITAASLANLAALRANRQDKIAQSVATIDRADETLNPGTHTRASLALPEMAFRNN
jgi:hypothetical protein